MLGTMHAKTCPDCIYLGTSGYFLKSNIPAIHQWYTIRRMFFSVCYRSIWIRVSGLPVCMCGAQQWIQQDSLGCGKCTSRSVSSGGSCIILEIMENMYRFKQFLQLQVVKIKLPLYFGYKKWLPIHPKMSFLPLPFLSTRFSFQCFWWPGHFLLAEKS